MKIDKTPAPIPPKSTDVAARPAQSEPSDKVATAAAERMTAAVAAAVAHLSGARTGKLEQIRAQVQAGTYIPDANVIADRILEAAMIDARVQAMLAGP
jgi:flagellar biosynthesis anti-sigma factor FlgM